MTAEGSLLADDTESYAEEAYEVKVFFGANGHIVLVMVILGQRVIYTGFFIGGFFFGGKNLFAN